MDHEINNDTRFSVSSSMSSYSASSILLVLPSAPFCYTLVGQITFSQELRWGQNKLIATQSSEWDKRVSTKDTNRNNLKQHETNEWKKYRSYSLVTNAWWRGGGGREERKTLTFLSRTRILDHRILRSEVFLSLLVNEPRHTVDT